MKTDYDVIIVGAGPAGASCANELVKNNINTLLIERHKTPINKCCSGLLTERALDSLYTTNFGNIPNDIVCSNKFIRPMFASTSLRKFREIPGYKFINIYRDKFNQWLLEKSKVKVNDNCTFLEIKNNKDIIEIKCKKGNKYFDYKCKYLIGADGANSKVRRIIDNKYKIESVGGAIQKIYKGKFNISDDVYHMSFSPKYSGDAFAWFSKKDDLTYIGTGWATKEKYKKTYYDIWYSFLKDKYKFDLKEIKKEFCFVEKGRMDNKKFFGKGNILIIGEAAGMVEIFIVGIPSALISGYLAARSIILSDKQTRALNIYKNKLRDEINYINDTWNNIKLY